MRDVWVVVCQPFVKRIYDTIGYTDYRVSDRRYSNGVERNNKRSEVSYLSTLPKSLAILPQSVLFVVWLDS